MSWTLALSLMALAAWGYLLACRGGFWLMRERDQVDAASAATTPSVTAIVPARDEAELIAQSVGSLLAQDYPGAFRVIVVDDQSDDGTADAARTLDSNGRLEVLRGVERPPGWTGKLWALKQGITRDAENPSDCLWFTDADIVHAPDNLRCLVERLNADNRVMVSLMAKLRCESVAERFLIPAFVFFFAALFPFSWVNRRDTHMAAAAGGCILVRRDAFERAGGIDAVRHEIIDDCALSRRMKAQGAIWLGLTERALSLRRYEKIGDVGQVVARSAFAQLHYSTLLLIGVILSMTLIFVMPPLVSVFGTGDARLTAIVAWLCMAVSFQPMLRFYARSPLWGVALPLIALCYTAFTIASAIQFWSGRGGLWKGRIQAMKQT